MIRKANAACILATIFALSSTWAEDVTPEQARLEAETELADETPVMVSLIAPVQAPYRSYDVTGFRLSLIYGECQDFAGFDLGVVNNTRGDFAGLAIGGVNIADDRMCGAQLGLVNWNGNDSTAPERRSVGVQLGALNYADSFRGLQDGYLNVSTGSLPRQKKERFSMKTNLFQMMNLVLSLTTLSNSMPNGNGPLKIGTWRMKLPYEKNRRRYVSNVSFPTT